MMTKKLNLVYEWIGPRGPLSNNRLPTVIDLVDQYVQNPPSTIRWDFHHIPHFYRRFESKCNIISASTLPDDIFLYELNFGNYNYRDMLHAFHPHDGILDHNVITPEVLSRVRDKRAFILITILHESFFNDDFLSAMRQYFKHKGILLTQIIYVSHCANGDEVYADHCARNESSPRIHMEYIPTTRIDKTDIGTNLPTTYNPGPREKTFLCFNRRYHPHRLIFFMMMTKRKLLNHFYMSMSKTQPESGQSFTITASHLLHIHSQYNFTINDIATCDAVLPLVLDNTNFESYPMESNPNDIEKYYSNSLINIITETFFFSKIIHVTEKTYKPIASLQPFIIIAAPRSLKHIRDMGFKTFSDFWDESYDLEDDHAVRFNKIFDLVESISKWSDEKKLEFSHQVKEIVEYNANHLQNIENVEIDAIVEKYGV